MRPFLKALHVVSSTGWKHKGILPSWEPQLSSGTIKVWRASFRNKGRPSWVFLRHISNYPTPTDSIPDVDAILLDGAAVINILKLGSAKTFKEYSEVVFLPFAQSKLQKTNRVDIIWDEYTQDSLKATTRNKRGKGTRRRVQPDTKLPGNWQAFLRIDDNRKELFAFPAQESVKIESEGKIIGLSTFGKLILLNSPAANTSRLSPCTHEEADTTKASSACSWCSYWWMPLIYALHCGYICSCLVYCFDYADKLDRNIDPVWDWQNMQANTSSHHSTNPRASKSNVHADVPFLHWMGSNIILSEQQEENRMEY